MVKFGLIESWNPVPGIVTSWAPTAASRQAATLAAADPAPPSHIQQAYLESAYRNRHAGFRFSRLCLLTFDIPGVLDQQAMTQALTAFVRRHDTFHSWFHTDDEGTTRRLLDPNDIELSVTDLRLDLTSDQIRAHVQTQTPGPDVWECFTFGVVEHDGYFTIYAAVDHLLTDGISQALTIYELRQLYNNAVNGTDDGLLPTASYAQYCARERSASAQLSLDSAPVRRWVEIVQANGGDLPTFPLELGEDGDVSPRTADSAFPLFGVEEAAAFDLVCQRAGAKFSGGIFAAAAIAQYELSGRARYLGLTPKSTRSTPGEWASIGWFASLIPIYFELDGVASFSELAGLAQQAFDAGKALGDTSYHRVLELVTPDLGIITQPGWTAPMISYVDVRKLPGADELKAANVGLFGSRGTSEDVFMWINRFNDHTSTVYLYPDTEQARESIARYSSKINDVFLSVARDGDYVIADSATTDSVTTDSANVGTSITGTSITDNSTPARAHDRITEFST